MVTANQVQAASLFGNVDQPVHFDNVAEFKAVIALQVGVEDSSAESSAESSSVQSSSVQSSSVESSVD